MKLSYRLKKNNVSAHLLLRCSAFQLVVSSMFVQPPRHEKWNFHLQLSTVGKTIIKEDNLGAFFSPLFILCCERFDLLFAPALSPHFLPLTVWCLVHFACYDSLSLCLHNRANTAKAESRSYLASSALSLYN